MYKTCSDGIKNVNPIRGQVKAAAALAEAESEKKVSYSHIAAGTEASEGEKETIFVEYSCPQIRQEP